MRIKIGAPSSGSVPGSEQKNIGAVYIHDVNPVSDGNVSEKVYLSGSDNNIITSCSSDSNIVEVKVIALIGESNLRPNVTVNSVNITNWDHTAYETDNRVLFLGTAEIDVSGGLITAEHEDGAEATCIVNFDTKPIISTVRFINDYPGAQTELKENDTFDIQVEADLPFVNIQIDNYEATKFSNNSVPENTINTTTATIAGRGNTTVARPVRVRVQKASGTWSDWKTSNEGGGSTDGLHTVFLNNTYPSIETINQSNITYPSGQEAIKNNETVIVHSTVSNFDTITYDSPNSQLNIPNTSTYEENKLNVERMSGDYNVSTNNYRITANRAANDATSSKSGVIYIAHADQIITISEPSYLRSGGNDGTSPQNYTVTLSSDQNLISAPTIADPPVNAGIWVSGFSGGPRNWNRTLQIHDDDIKGSYTYGSLSTTNLAGKEVTTYTGDNNYTIRGFVSRNITLPAFAQTTDMNVAATNYSNVVLSWSVKSLPNKRPVGTTATPDSGSWCLDTLDTNPTTIRILDTAATDAQSQESTITIEETV